MIVYHGSNVVVQNPKIIESNRYLDFGDGFYTTTNKVQAINFAKKVAAQRGSKPILNTYEFDENILKSSCKIKEFESANEEWIDFVSKHRSGALVKEKYDLVIGPVADDDVYRSFQLYLVGLLSLEQTVEALKIKRLFNQYVFKNEKALLCLKFVDAKEV